MVPGVGTAGPIVARPFTAEPPKPLIGERTREEQADPLRVAIEEFTTAPVGNVDQIPVINTLAEYRAVKERKEPAILFDKDVYVYDDQSGDYKPLNWKVEEANDDLWSYVQYTRQLAIVQYQQRAFQQQQARMQQMYNRLGQTAYAQPYGRIPGGGAGQNVRFGTRSAPGANLRNARMPTAPTATMR